MIKFHVSTAIRIAVSTHVAEILRDAGPEVAFRYFVVLRVPVDFMAAQGLHAREIAKPTGVHPAKLCKYRGSGNCVSLMDVLSARVLRLLATNHIFIEVSPDVFANNRLSTVLDTGKPLEGLISK